jgi:hypothetical protein
MFFEKMIVIKNVTRFRKRVTSKKQKNDATLTPLYCHRGVGGEVVLAKGAKARRV